MKKAFTLIELLVVIAIIAIIMAILLPVFSKVKGFAQSATCMSNFKQFGVAFALYGADADDTLINPSYFDRETTDTGQGPLDAYIHNPGNEGKPSIYLCPSDNDVYFQPTLLGGPSPSDLRGFATTYGMNVFLQAGNQANPDPDQCFTPPADQLNVSWNAMPFSNESNLFDNGTNYNSGGIVQTSIVEPASTDLLFESVVEAGNSTTDGLVGVSQRGGDYMNVQGFFQTQDQADHWYVATSAYNLQHATSPWHGAVNNYLFADGHVRGRVPERLGYDIAANSSSNIWLVHDGRDGGTPVAGKC